jgi:hypothetical protein
LLDYFFHKFNANDFRLVMTILVKNELDIIEANIRTHASLGVDAFVVMDNDSNDGTRELLSKLQNEFEIIIIDEKGTYNQAKWMKQLAYVAKNQLKADWVINNDADEFWLPQNELNLKENLSFKGDVLTCERFNVLLDEVCIKSGNFFDAKYVASNPLYATRHNQVHDNNLSMSLIKTNPKTIINPHGLIFLRGGNHKALHIANFKDYLKSGYDKIKYFSNIAVFHYPIRSYEAFQANIKHRKQMLDSGKKVSMGVPYKRWIRLFNEGKLQEEFNEKIIIKNDDLKTLAKYGVVRYDETISQKIVQN